MQPFDLGHGLENTHVLITGAAGHIGRVTTHAFLSAGCRVTALDVSETGLQELDQQLERPSTLQKAVADTSDEDSIRSAFVKASQRWGAPRCVVALAGLDLSVLDHRSILDKSFNEWKRVIDVNINGTFLTAKMWLQGLLNYIEAPPGIHEKASTVRRNDSFIIIGSESGHWGEVNAADYATSKSAIQGGLLQSLKADIARKCESARVNAIAPGPVDTDRFREECKAEPNQLWVDSQATTARGRPVPAEAVAKACIFLASDNLSGAIHGQTLNVDQGKMGKLMWERGQREEIDKQRAHVFGMLARKS